MRTRQLSAVATALAGVALALPGTASAASPTATTGPARNVTYSGATLTGTVNPHGSETDYYFQYGTTKGYGAQTPLVVAGNGTSNVAASASLTGLSPNTTYHYRLVALGAARTNGGDRSFTTPKVPLSVSIATSPNPVPFGSPFVVTGALSGTGNGNRPIVLQATPFPYSAPFANVGNAELTNPDGSFSFTFAGLLQTAKLRVVTQTNPPVVSQEIVENVAVHVVLHVKRGARRGFVRLSGTVTPPQVGVAVVIQRLTRKGPKQVGSTVVRTGTNTTARFTATVRKRKHALYQAAVIFPAGKYSASTSNPVLVR